MHLCDRHAHSMASTRFKAGPNVTSRHGALGTLKRRVMDCVSTSSHSVETVFDPCNGQKLGAMLGSLSSFIDLEKAGVSVSIVQFHHRFLYLKSYAIFDQYDNMIFILKSEDAMINALLQYLINTSMQELKSKRALICRLTKNV